MSAACTLCGSRGTSVLGRARMRDLEALYWRAYGVRIDSLTRAHDELRLLRCADCDLGFFDPPITGDAGFYEQLESFDWYYTKSKPEFDLAAKLVEPSHDVLEIGCGAGHFGRQLRCRSYAGLELTALAAEAARGAGLQVFQESIEAHAARRAASYDVVCGFQILEHVARPRSLLDAAVRCLRHGGRLVLSVPSADGYVARATNNCLNLPPHHVTWWSDAALGSVARELGLELVHLEHEALADEHAEGYAHTLVSAGLRRRGAGPRLVDLSLRGRLTDRLLSLAVPLVRRRVLAMRPRPAGHSVTAIYQCRPA